jgi:hypothetical protein
VHHCRNTSVASMERIETRTGGSGELGARLAKEATAAASADSETKDSEGGTEEIVLYSDEYYTAQKAKRQAAVAAVLLLVLPLHKFTRM